MVNTLVWQVSIPAEAIQPDWSEAYRKSWGMKLHAASSAEDLLQVSLSLSLSENVC